MAAEKEEMIVEEKPEELDGRFFALNTTWIWILADALGMAFLVDSS